LIVWLACATEMTVKIEGCHNDHHLHFQIMTSSTIRDQLVIWYTPTALDSLKTCLERGNRIKCTIYGTQMSNSAVIIDQSPTSRFRLHLHGATIICNDVSEQFEPSSPHYRSYKKLCDQSYIFETVDDIYDFGFSHRRICQINVTIRVTNKDRRRILAM